MVETVIMTVESTAFWATSLMNIGRLTFMVSLVLPTITILSTAVMAVMAMAHTAIRLGATECILGEWAEESCRVVTEWEYLALTF